MLEKPQLIPNEGKNSEGQRKRKGLSRKKLAFSSADQRELIVLQTLGLFIYLFLVLVQLLIPAKTPHAQLTCVVHYVPIWQQDWHLPWQQPADASNTLYVCVPTTAQRGNRKNIPECATLMLWLTYELTISYLVCNKDSRNMWGSELGSSLSSGLTEILGKAEDGQGLWELRLKSEVSVEMKTICSWGFPTPNIPFP